MDSLKQYIDLYSKHTALVNKNGSAVMNSCRQNAFEALKSMSLPKKGSENYEKIDLSEILAPDYGLNIARVNIDVNPTSAFRCGVPSVSPAPLMVFNDIFSSDGEKKPELPDGVYAGSLKSFCMDFPDKAAEYYSKIADIKNPIVALNTLYAQDGIALWVKKNVKVEKPVQIVNILENGMPLMAVRRILIILEEGAELKILACDHTQNNAIKFLNLQVAEIFAGANSKLDFYGLEESTELTSRLSSFYLKQQERSEVLIDGITLYNGVTRNEYYSVFEGEEAILKLYGMGIEDRRRHLDIYSRIIHKAKGCHTDELFKYVLDGQSSGAFGGLIKVLPGADKTEAFQSNRNIISDEGATMYSKPQLEIYDDDVKCSHGSATGQLDETQIFYMQTRGIPEKEAKLLLKQAFMADIINCVALPELRERLILLVEKRFNGDEAGCSSCRQTCIKL